MLGAEEQRRWEFFYKNICGWEQKFVGTNKFIRN
jgi:hypothetical protein